MGVGEIVIVSIAILITIYSGKTMFGLLYRDPVKHYLKRKLDLANEPKDHEQFKDMKVRQDVNEEKVDMIIKAMSWSELYGMWKHLNMLSKQSKKDKIKIAKEELDEAYLQIFGMDK